jgi:hypothetical protein
VSGALFQLAIDLLQAVMELRVLVAPAHEMRVASDESAAVSLREPRTGTTRTPEEGRFPSKVGGASVELSVSSTDPVRLALHGVGARVSRAPDRRACRRPVHEARAPCAGGARNAPHTRM